MIYILHFLTIYFCLRLLYKRAGNIALDPGLILVFVTAFSVTANIFFYEFLKEFNNNAWVLWESRESMQNIVLLNIIFISIFTFFYLTVCKLQSYEKDTISNQMFPFWKFLLHLPSVMFRWKSIRDWFPLLCIAVIVSINGIKWIR